MAQINTGETTSVVSLVGIAGNGKCSSFRSLHPQSAQSQTDEGLHEHRWAVAGLEEQQLLSNSSFSPLQQLASVFLSFTDSIVEQSHARPDPNSIGCTPIASIANIIDVAKNTDRVLGDLLFMADVPTQMIVGTNETVKSN